MHPPALPGGVSFAIRINFVYNFCLAYFLAFVFHNTNVVLYNFKSRLKLDRLFFLKFSLTQINKIIINSILFLHPFEIIWSKGTHSLTVRLQSRTADWSRSIHIQAMPLWVYCKINLNWMLKSIDGLYMDKFHLKIQKSTVLHCRRTVSEWVL